jgi:hypothetical protein
MADAASSNPFSWLLEPLRGAVLAAAALVIWLLGALYCSGYEALSTGYDNWPASLIWSAVAVMPWFALLEWAKRPAGRAAMRTMSRFAAVLVAVAAASILAELAVNWIAGDRSAPLALLLMRRLPAIAATILLIALSRRTGNGARADRAVPEELVAIAATIDWVEAADNYVAVRVDGRTAMRRMTMREAEQALGGHGFVRIHRRFLVNGSRVAELRGQGKAFVRLTDGTELPVGQAFRDNLRPAH